MGSLSDRTDLARKKEESCLKIYPRFRRHPATHIHNHRCFFWHVNRMADMTCWLLIQLNVFFLANLSSCSPKKTLRHVWSWIVIIHLAWPFDLIVQSVCLLTLFTWLFCLVFTFMARIWWVQSDILQNNWFRPRRSYRFYLCALLQNAKYFRFVLNLLIWDWYSREKNRLCREKKKQIKVINILKIWQKKSVIKPINQKNVALHMNHTITVSVISRLQK